MDLEKLRRYMGSCPYTPELLEEADSTNSLLKKGSYPHGQVLLARRQRGGRGRLGRQFSSPEGGVYLSLLLELDAEPSQLLHLTLMVAVAVRRGILDCCRLPLEIKWPNDLVYQGKKICGILVELLPPSPAASSRVVIGVGINGNTLPSEVADMAESLHRILGRPVNLSQLTGQILCRLREMELGLFTKKAVWLEEYRQNCVTLHKQVKLVQAGRVRIARCLDIDEEGALLVEYPDGQQERISTGEVSVRGMYGYTEKEEHL